MNCWNSLDAPTTNGCSAYQSFCLHIFTSVQQQYIIYYFFLYILSLYIRLQIGSEFSRKENNTKLRGEGVRRGRGVYIVLVDVIVECSLVKYYKIIINITLGTAKGGITPRQIWFCQSLEKRNLNKPNPLLTFPWKT